MKVSIIVVPNNHADGIRCMKEHLKLANILVLISILTIYFQLYWHYWFVKLLGGYVVNTLLPIMIVLFAFLLRESVSPTVHMRIDRRVFYLLAALVGYVVLASLSILINEEGFNMMKRYLIYIYSPVLIFLSLLGWHGYKKNMNIQFTLKALFFAGIIFSAYAAFTYSINAEKVPAMPILETNRGEILADTGATFTVGDLTAIRYTIPGISSTTFGMLIVPLVLVGLMLRKESRNKLNHFLYTGSILFLVLCVLKTVSRGPVVALTVGMVYITAWRWFTIKEVMAVTLILITSLYTFAELIFFRLVITFAALFHMDVSYLGDNVSGIMKDSRLLSMHETLTYICQHPIWGIGMSQLIDYQDLTYGKEHNNFLSIAASFGVPAVAFYFAFIALLFVMLHVRIRKIAGDPLNKNLGIVLGAGSLALITYLNFAPAEFHFIWIWLGLSVAWMRNIRKDFLPATV